MHIPFCQRRCSYCDFSIAVRRRVPAREYVDAIRRELDAPGLTGPLETVYFGGGTPSLVPPGAIADLLDLVPAREPDAEITLEANPEDVNRHAALAWRTAGVNRVSLGVQSFDEGVLRWMHRVHDADRARAAVATLRSAGFDNISLDLIFGVPASLARDWSRDLDQAIALEPEHLSLYGLTVEPRTPLERWIARGAASAPTEERYADDYVAAHERLRGAGYVFYEVSNAAREGRHSRHNSAYWTGHPYTGVGPAAHSFDGRTRRWNIAAWEAYRRAVESGQSPIESEEVLTAAQREIERLYLGLRTSEGVMLESLDRVRAQLVPLLQQGWLVPQGARVKCSVEGWLRLDALVSALTAPVTTS